MIGIKDQCFGVEIEMTGQSCELDGGDVPRRAESLIHRLEALGALEILEV
jgi:hypothetical protein